MSYNSLEYLLFIIVVFSLYWTAGFNRTVQNVLLSVAGAIFLGWCDWRMAMPVMILGTLSFVSAIGIEKNKTNETLRKSLMWLTIFVGFGALIYFKYCGFFVDSIGKALCAVGVDVKIAPIHIIIPLGISFYTFQLVGYVIDIYCMRYKATYDIPAFAAFVFFFPKLLAGPIERASNLLEQFLKPRRFDYPLAVDGCRQILWGLFKKLVIADNCVTLVGNVFNGSTPPTGIAVAVGAFVYTIQIYCDFSGYSDIAIGCGKLFGIRCMVNFRFPYFAHNISDFWRRWHISLTTWFRDYLYIPLGGSRTTNAKHIRNIFIVFLASGLWHGSNWTFVGWGLYHALLFLPLLLSAKLNANRQVLPKFIGGGLTFVFVSLGWTIFIAPDIGTWRSWMECLFSLQGSKSLYGLCIRSVPWVFIALGLAFEWFNRNREHGLAGVPSNTFVRRLIYVSIVMAVVFFRGSAGSFIYAQF